MDIQNIILKLKNKHFLSLLGNGSMSVLAMLTVSILLRNMEPGEIGYWFFFQSVFVLLDTFRVGFLQIAMIKFYTGAEKSRADTVLGSVWFLSLLITGTLVGVNIIAAFFLPYIDSIGIISIIKWFGITFLFTLPSAIASWISQSDERFDRLLLLRFITQGAFIIMVLLVIFFMKLSLDLLLVINALSSGIVSLYCIFKGWTRISTLSKRTRESIMELFHFGKYSVGTTISTNLLRSSDTFIIMSVLGAAGPAAVTMYTVPMRLMEIIEIPLRSFLSTAMPSMSGAFNRGNKIEVVEIMQKYAGTLTLALFPVSVVAIIFADFAITLLGGKQYSGTNAVVVYRILMSFALFFPIDRFLGITLDIIHQPKINFYKVLVMLAINVTFDFIGIYVFGNIVGVGLATLFTFLSGVAFGYYWLRKYLDFTLFGFFKTGFIEIRMILQEYVFKNKTVG
ncbi:oligosaccharide flippase family protein [Arcicella aquatica]|uniref:Oligosaccharide flippase family protein n=1 Tax=Arcicella aquatica TaxID=217141 RepID=A0ABU5QN73_9BACT|nr:oligosaccharide flippase family protein [Arcicella aquatica]MEA5258189.1 oligosaccharide flippase family protein [Arcicella aquatica]